MPPIKYLEAGAKLYNNGQYPLAAKYLAAAQMYRDQLTASEQTVLDAYLSESAKAQEAAVAAAAWATRRRDRPQPRRRLWSAEVPPAAAPEAAPAMVVTEVPPAAAPGAPPAEMSPADPASQAQTPAPAPTPTQIMAASAVDQTPGTAGGRVETTDIKQKARWMLHVGPRADPPGKLRRGREDGRAGPGA